MLRSLLLSALLLLGMRPAMAQSVTVGPDSVLVRQPTDTADNAPVKHRHAGLTRPAKAALWALIPAGGQVYNRDYWKVPLVLVGVGTPAYFVYWNHDRYRRFQRAQTRRTAGQDRLDDPDKLTRSYRTESLSRGVAFYRRNRDFSVILTAAFYGLSVMEALVDAHLATFTISDDLSLRASPAVLPLAGRAAAAPGIGLTLTLR